MLTFDPPISVKNLFDVRPGSLVHWEDRVGICTLPVSDPAKRTCVVVYQPAQRIFEYVGGEWPLVIAYEGHLEIQPDLSTFVENTSPDPRRPDATLYLEKGQPFISLSIGVEIRCVNLETGEMRSGTPAGILSGFRGWSVSVVRPNGKRHKILEVGAWSADDDEDSVDPE
jgi:hypothetical protein